MTVDADVFIARGDCAPIARFEKTSPDTGPQRWYTCLPLAHALFKLALFLPHRLLAVKSIEMTVKATPRMITAARPTQIRSGFRTFSARRAFVVAAVVGSFCCAGSTADAQFDDFRPSGDANETQTSTGEVRIDNALIELIDTAEIASTQTGVLAFEVPEEGTRVEKDEVIARLDDTVPRASLAVAEAQASTDAEVRSAAKIVEVAESEVEAAIATNERFENAVSQQEFNRLKLTADRSKFDVDVAKRDLAVAQARVEEARELLKTYEITAPFSGVVRKRLKRNGEAVRQGDPVLELVSTERLRVTARVPVEDLGAFQVGQNVLVEPQYQFRGGSAPLSGKVKFVDLFGEADLTLRLVDVQIEVLNTDGRLIPGLQATVVAKPSL